MISNLRNLPLPIVAAIENDMHISQGSDIGAASIASPAKQFALMTLHRGELTEDAADRIWALVGQAIHEILYRAAKDRNQERRKLDDAYALIESVQSLGDPATDDYIADALNNLDNLRLRYDSQPQPFRTFAEERWEMTVLGWRVAARCDHLTLDDDGTLTDYKVSSVWSVKGGNVKEDWIAQANVTRYCGTQAIGIRPKKLQATVICRDWRKNEKLRYGDDYPDVQVETVPIPLWTDDLCQAYLEDRVRIHQQARAMADAGGGALLALPDCTPAERWEKPTTFAVTKRGNKKADKLFLGADQEPAARAHAMLRTQTGKGIFEVTLRPGESPRCQQYCAVLPFCNQGQRIVAALAAPAGA